MITNMFGFSLQALIVETVGCRKKTGIRYRDGIYHNSIMAHQAVNLFDEITVFSGR